MAKIWLILEHIIMMTDAFKNNTRTG